MENIINNANDNKNDDYLGSESNSDSESDIQSVKEKMESFNDDNINSKNDNQSNKEEILLPNNDISITSKSFVEKKTIQEVLDESKLKTEQELIKLGQQMKEKEQKEENLNNNYESNLKIIEKYKNIGSITVVDDIIKNKKYIELKEIIDIFLNHSQIVDQKIQEKIKLIEKLDTQIDDALQDNKDLMSENNTLEEKEENYWIPRVKKLRNKLIERNKFMKYIHGSYLLLIFHTFILTKYGINSYFNFWVNLFYILYKIIVFMLFFLPNTYKIITDPSKYVLIYNIITTYFSNKLTFILNFIFDIPKSFFYYIFQSNLTLGLLIGTFIFIKIYNKINKK